jgi:8-oxo-(d)GTP phosphatase
VLLLLVRHGQAGSKRHWRGDDRMRPLTQQGFAEAEGLERLLAPFAPTRIVSSPYLRCIQSVSRLAETLGLHVEHTKRLIPAAGKSAESYLRRVSTKETGAIVLCTHGEVIHALQQELSKRHPELFGDDPPREKGSLWVLNRVNGEFVKSEYIAPIQVRRSSL